MSYWEFFLQDLFKTVKDRYHFEIFGRSFPEDIFTKDLGRHLELLGSRFAEVTRAGCQVRDQRFTDTNV